MSRFQRMRGFIILNALMFISTLAIHVFVGAREAYPLWVSSLILTATVLALWFTIPASIKSGEKVKMYCVFAKESLDKMKGVRGKMISQGGHAYLHAFWNATERFPHLAQAYRASGHAYKITLVVPTVADLHALQVAYSGVCGVSLVTDAGFTVFAGPTTTCLGIGPLLESQIGDDLKALKTLT